MELGLRGKNVIVTGGGSNIGRAIVHAFAQEGCNITIAELAPSQGEKVAAEVLAMGTGSNVQVVATDVTQHEQVNKMVEQAIAEFGSVDVLVNNVGWTVDRLFLEKPRAEWEKEVQVNLWGAINCMQGVLPHMTERESGAIVSISSDAGRMGEYREAVYSACKAGVIALSKSIARETGRYGIRANVVCPGLVVPSEGESISDESMWNQMRDVFTEDVLERVKRGYPVPAVGDRRRGGQRGGVPGLRRRQLHHRPDPQRQRWLYHDVVWPQAMTKGPGCSRAFCLRLTPGLVGLERRDLLAQRLKLLDQLGLGLFTVVGRGLVVQRHQFPGSGFDLGHLFLQHLLVHRVGDGRITSPPDHVRQVARIELV